MAAPETGMRTDSETDSDGSKNVAVTSATLTRRPTPVRTDEVCNRSVRDKIAMFSRATSAPGGENKDSVSSSSASSTSSSAYSTGSPDSSPAASPKAAYSTLPRKLPPPQWPQQYPASAAAPAVSSPSPPVGGTAATDHRRSQSLVEQPYSKYFNTMNAYAEMGRSSLNALIEQRRRSMSKLRGLVIPEKVDTGAAGSGADDRGSHPAVVIPDLPLVIQTSRPDDEADTVGAVLCPPTKTYVNGPPPVMGTVTRYANPVKTVARQLHQQPQQQREQPQLIVAPVPEQRRPSSASSSPSSSSSSSSSSLNSSREELRHIHDERPPSSAKSKGGSFKADSDEDSALSSSRSSTSLQQYSPASSPPPPPPQSQPPPSLPAPLLVNLIVPPSPTAASEIGKRVLKAESVEAINRKNVLCSARISSGKPEPMCVGGSYAKTEYHQPTDGSPLKSAPKTAFVVTTGTGGVGGGRYTHNRMSSMESTTSDDSSMQYAVNAEPFGSISSLASSTSLISQQELQQLIDDANQTLEENGSGGGVNAAAAAAVVPMSVEVMVVILHRDMATSSVGITLAGGADYETKEITVSLPW